VVLALGPVEELIGAEGLPRREGRRALQGGHEPAPCADDEVVVVDSGAAGQLDRVILRPNGADRPLDEACTLLGRKGLELVARGWPEIERLLDEQRLVEELRRRGDERLLDSVTREIGQGEEGLHPGHAAAGYDDARTLAVRFCIHLSSLARDRVSPIGGEHGGTEGGRLMTFHAKRPFSSEAAVFESAPPARE
jgi:hypothetical protein